MKQNNESEWRLRDIREAAPGQFKAIVRGPRGKQYIVGTFHSKEEAETAITDALTAKWNG